MIKDISIMRVMKSATFALALAATAVVATAPDTFAATQTWTGTDCATDCNFSNTLNWQSGVVPVNGDTVILTDVNLNPSPRNDIANLSLASITLNGEQVYLDANLVIAGAINSGTTPNATAGGIFTTGAGNLVLGSNTTVAGTHDVNLNYVGGGSIVLGGFTLTNALSDPDQYPGLSVYAPITGNGTVVWAGYVDIGSVNTYSGTTTVPTNGNVRFIQSSTNPFGTSIVNIASGGRVSFKDHTTLTVANTINVAGIASLDIGDLYNDGTALTFDVSGAYTFSGIVMASNARFVSNGATVNLAGITANGNCVNYVYETSYFSNGPVACVTTGTLQMGAVGAVGAVAAAPNTALRALTTTNPAIVAVLGLLSVVALAFVARKVAARN